jgi:hypothetical protein
MAFLVPIKEIRVAADDSEPVAVPVAVRLFQPPLAKLRVARGGHLYKMFSRRIIINYCSGPAEFSRGLRRPHIRVVRIRESVRRRARRRAALVEERLERVERRRRLVAEARQ